MPRAKHFSDYPEQFSRVMIDAVRNRGVEIPFPSLREARNFRARLYAFRRDLVNQMQTEDDHAELSRLNSLHRHASSLSFRITRGDSGATLHIHKPEDGDPVLRNL